MHVYKNVDQMQVTKLHLGSLAAILTFQIHKLWRRFLRIVTSKDKGPFLMTPVILIISFPIAL